MDRATRLGGGETPPDSNVSVPTLGERRADSSDQSGPLHITIPGATKRDELRETVVPRMAGQPSINATAVNPAPEFFTPPINPPPTTAAVSSSAAAAVNSSRRPTTTTTTSTTTGTTRKIKTSTSRQPLRRSTDQGYEGGVERHGQANDFVDEAHDSDSDDNATGGRKTPTIQPPHPRNSNTINNSAGIHSTIKAALNSAGDDSFGQSIRRNRNPSTGPHHHQRLPHSRQSSFHHPSGKPGLQRTASTGSMRSLEANMHPFPTPGHKQGESQTSHDDWKSVEEKRLDEDEKKEKHWKRWGPYVSERQWATVREDYSANGDAWTHFPHEHARSRAYRWGEDGLGGISDNHGKMCFSVALWNGVDPILKERMFGVTGHQGNHGEDVKEMYYYLDSTPTHS
ncbi:hypothetical protein P7C70_g8980, partial [Phenoliferia sp. Uapishka_3]